MTVRTPPPSLRTPRLPTADNTLVLCVMQQGREGDFPFAVHRLRTGPTLNRQ